MLIGVILVSSQTALLKQVPPPLPPIPPNQNPPFGPTGQPTQNGLKEKSKKATGKHTPSKITVKFSHQKFSDVRQNVLFEYYGHSDLGKLLSIICRTSSIQFNVYLPHSMFSYSSIISNSLGAGALNKPYWAHKESPWYINLLINYSEFT